MTKRPTKTPASVEWVGEWDGRLRLLDQTVLPGSVEFVDCERPEQAWEAIKMLRVRGAPAIGIAAGYAVLLGLKDEATDSPINAAICSKVEKTIDYLATSRPTAVNLFWALDRMRRKLKEFEASVAFHPSSDVSEGSKVGRTKTSNQGSLAALGRTLLSEAVAIHEEDRAMCRAIGRFGASLIGDGMGLLTHCNTGGLATAEYGTALSAFFTAQDEGKEIHVYADETRPLLQGARLTAWELMQRDVPCTLICDSMAAQVMREGKIQAVFVGADRITARGDAANKIGTYGVAVLAKHHGIPFYVAAPSSTFDLNLVDGNDIPIEQRQAVEITEAFGKRTAPLDVNVYNPAFDVTPAELISAIITEKGIIQPVNQSNIVGVLRSFQPKIETA